ncbi:MAG: GNAT family N-acetyltransferase [Candidatus Diapherotrites archaeon]|nr:GNAT family N-acetyltransferase [Candidatus Diapherotrites archaeon]
MAISITEPAPEFWDERLLKFGAAHIYSTKEYARVMQKSFGFKPIFFCSNDSMLLGFEQPLKGVASKLGTGFVAFAPPVISNESFLPELLAAVEEECRRRRIISITIWGSTVWNKPELFNGFESIKMQNVVARLEMPEADLFGSLGHAARKNLTKCRAFSEAVSEGGKTDLGDYYLYYKKHHESEGLEVYPKKFFDALYEEIIENKVGKFFVLRDSDGVFAAGLMVGSFGKSVYELSISSNWEKRSLFPNDILKWHAMKWANSNGFVQFDLSNIAVDAKEGSKKFNVNRFKKKFGKVVEYHAYKKRLGVAKILSKLKK